MGEYLGACDTYLKLALRAQSQCRATLETLTEEKKPRSVAIVGQANIAHGHQQINNGLTRSADTERVPNELLDQEDGKRLDTGTTRAAGGDDSPLEAVGVLNTAEDA